ncbi:MAG TPA: arginine deiminase family protein [Novosphingobium sp.]|nr:arginine deiminase family protein [Novosphingobium sp.]
MRVYDFNRAIMRQPAPSVIDGLRDGDGPPPTFPGIAAEHAAYASALEEAGVAVTSLPPLPAYPDAIFVEDPALVFSEGAIRLRPGAPSRLGEGAALAPVLAAQFPRVLELTDGYVDGGDVLVTPRAVFIGQSARTDRTGAEALASLLATLGKSATLVETPAGTLHLKSAVTLIDEETVLATQAVAAAGIFRNFKVLVVPDKEAHGANVLRVNDVVLAGNRYPRTLDMLDSHGLEVRTLSVNGIVKIDAGLTCMSLRWWADD